MGKGWGPCTGWLDLLLESRCPLCQRSSQQPLCQDCQKQVKACQLTDRQSWQGSLPVFAWGLYGGALKRSIGVLKYDNQPKLARPLGQWLGQAWLASPLSGHQNLIVIPIPMHTAKQRQRGFNQAELIARSFCQRTRLPLQPHSLIRVRSTEAQFNLSPAEREHNLANAFEVNRQWRDRPAKSVLLIDDIYTTGATARAAAIALQQQQVSVYGLVAVAKSGGT
jgi:ComF family protein